jgi:hypothetical protein
VQHHSPKVLQSLHLLLPPDQVDGLDANVLGVLNELQVPAT